MPTYPIGPNRYQIAELTDGRLLAFDTKMPQAYLLTPKAANGSYRLSRSGSLSVRVGIIAGVQQPAKCTGYQIEQLALGHIRLSRPTEPAWQLKVGSEPAAGRTGGHPHRFAILDLQGGDLLLVKTDGASELRVARAPDGVYRQVGGHSITVSGGAAAGVAGGPIYQYADDFAP